MLSLESFNKNRKNNSSAYTLDIIIVHTPINMFVTWFRLLAYKGKQQHSEVNTNAACVVATEPSLLLYSFVLTNLLTPIQSDVRPTNDLLNILLVIIFVFVFFHCEIRFSPCFRYLSLSLRVFVRLIYPTLASFFVWLFTSFVKCVSWFKFVSHDNI